MMRGPPGEAGKDGRDGKDGIPGEQLAVCDNSLRHLSFSRHSPALKNEILKNAIFHKRIRRRLLIHCFPYFSGMKGDKGEFGAPGSLGPRG